MKSLFKFALFALVLAQTIEAQTPDAETEIVTEAALACGSCRK